MGRFWSFYVLRSTARIRKLSNSKNVYWKGKIFINFSPQLNIRYSLAHINRYLPLSLSYCPTHFLLLFLLSFIAFSWKTSGRIFVMFHRTHFANEKKNVFIISIVAPPSVFFGFIFAHINRCSYWFTKVVFTFCDKEF